MANKCPRCGYENPEDLLTCRACGFDLRTPQPTQQTSQPSPSSSSSSPQSSQSPYERAASILIRNLGLILPAFVELVALILFTFPHANNAIRAFLSAVNELVLIVVLMVTANEAPEALEGVRLSLGKAWERTKAQAMGLSSVFLILFLLQFLVAYYSPPLGWLVMGVANAIAFTASCLTARGVGTNVGHAARYYVDLFSRNWISGLVILLSSILSSIPLIDLLAIPYGILVAYLA